MNAPLEILRTGSATTRAEAAEFGSHVDFIEGVVAEWLSDPDVTVACGRWSDGAISEILPRGRAQLLPALYDGCFAGVRELRLDDGPHHLHIDLGRIHRIAYAVAPCVCFGFKPSFEVRLLTVGTGGAPSDQWVVSMMPSAPYHGQTLKRAEAERFFRRARAHASARPDAVEIVVDENVRAGPQGASLLDIVRAVAGEPDSGWEDLLGSLAPGRRSERESTRSTDPACVALLRDALALKDASLVVYRDRTLIEFKTEKLDGVHRYSESGHVSWQIGAFDDHHCHLALSEVARVQFSAEPVSCQGGGLNYAAWFLTDGPCGNPYRRDGYFSVVLNRPYSGNEPRPEVIDPMLELYRRHRHEPWVSADETFLCVLAEGPPTRRPAGAARPTPAGMPTTASAPTRSGST